MKSFSKEVEKPPKAANTINPLYMKPRFEASIDKGNMKNGGLKKPEEWIK